MPEFSDSLPELPESLDPSPELPVLEELLLPDVPESENSGNSTSVDNPASEIDVSNIRSDASTDKEEAEDLADIIPEETVILDVYSQLANYSGTQLGWFADVIKEKFNVELNIINNPEGTFATRMESKNLGDIVVFGGYGDHNNAANAGLLLDWEEDDLGKDYAPFVWNNMKPALIKNKTLSGSDGKLHGFGNDVALSAGDIKAYDYWPALRFDLYEQIGKPEVNTLEDYITVFEQMKEICPTADNGKETYAVSLFPSWYGDMVMYVKALGALYGYDEFGFGLYDTYTDTYEDALKPDGMYLRCLKWYNKLYQKGLVDPNSMTQPDTEQGAAQANGQAFFDLFSWRGSVNYNTEEHIAAGKAMYAVPPKDAKTSFTAKASTATNVSGLLARTRSTPSFVLLSSIGSAPPNGFMTTQYVPKGDCWNYNSDGKAFLTETGLKAQTDKKTTEVRGSSFEDGEFKINNTTLVVDCVNPKTGETFNKDNWFTKPETEPSEILKKWQEWSGYENANDLLASDGYKSVNIMSLYAPTEKSQELDAKWKKVQEVIKNGSWNAMYAESDEKFNEEVAKMTEEANKNGYQECVEYQQHEAELRKAAVAAARAEAQ